MIKILDEINNNIKHKPMNIEYKPNPTISIKKNSPKL